WRESWSEFKEILGTLRNAAEVFQQKTQQVQRANQELAAVLNESETKGFSLLFEAAKRRIQKGEQAAGRREEVTDQLQGLKKQQVAMEQDRARSAQAVKVAATEWTKQCITLDLPEGISPQSGLALLQERKELLSTFD